MACETMRRLDEIVGSFREGVIVRVSCGGMLCGECIQCTARAAKASLQREQRAAQDEIARLTRELDAARAENRRLRGALERVVDGGCERFAGTDCWQIGMDPNAKDYADRVCDPCFARLAFAKDTEGQP